VRAEATRPRERIPLLRRQRLHGPSPLLCRGKVVGRAGRPASGAKPPRERSGPRVGQGFRSIAFSARGIAHKELPACAVVSRENVRLRDPGRTVLGRKFFRPVRISGQVPGQRRFSSATPPLEIPRPGDTSPGTASRLRQFPAIHSISPRESAGSARRLQTVVLCQALASLVEMALPRLGVPSRFS